MSEFKITYQVSDGYTGGNHAQTCIVNSDDLFLKDVDTDEELEEMFWEGIREHFESYISFDSQDCAKFVEWVKEHKAINDRKSHE